MLFMGLVFLLFSLHGALASQPEGTYEDYMRTHENDPYANATIVLSARHGMVQENAVCSLEGDLLLWQNEKGSVLWEFTVEQEGLYEIEIAYCLLEGNGVAIERGILIDGERPYQELRNFSLSRRWVRRESVLKKDNQGNDIRPALVEESALMTERVRSSDGLYDRPMAVYLKAGNHTLSLLGIREPIAIQRICLTEPESARENTGKEENIMNPLPVIKIQGEDFSAVSDQTLYPLSDSYNSCTEPFEIGRQLINYIGDYNWRMPGQWIEWRFTVEKEGYYKLMFRTEQTYLIGLPVTRRITVDGELPAASMNSVSFPYSNEWYGMTVENGGEPVLIYLAEGEHTLRMEVNLGSLAETIRKVRQVATRLTQLYYKVIMITGTVPDTLRDYQLEKRIQGIENTLKEAADVLREQIDVINQMAGRKVAEIQLLETMAIQLESLAQDPDTLPSRLDNFRENFSGLSSWVLSITEQPLNIDYIVLAGAEYQFEKINPGFFEKAQNTLRNFFISFTKDYSNLGNVYDSDKAITVWAELGQEQAATLKTLIDESFTPETGIAVNLNILSSSDALLYAASQSDPPQVVIGTGGSLPVDYGIRSALVDFNEFEDAQEVFSQFYSSALAPFTYEGKVFALPVTQSFPILFYRQDILEDLDMSVPSTWEEVYALIAHLQENHLTMGAGGFYDMFLLQKGGTYYSPENDTCLLASPEGVEAFEQYTQLYTHYGLPQEYDFFNRFRTGEMPLGIEDFTMYNTLTVAAPEIKGLWSVAPVPGTLQEDGTVNRAVSGSPSACVMFSSARHREEGWTFLKWFLSSETQIAYGRELEAVLGSGARYATANVKAMEGLSWPSDVYEIILEQWKDVVGIPVIPGSYYVSRHLNNAFREVVSLGELPREAITKYVDMINSEIRKKREEFGLPVAAEEVNP